MIKGWVRGLSYLTNWLNPVGYNVTVRRISEKLIFRKCFFFLGWLRHPVLLPCLDLPLRIYLLTCLSLWSFNQDQYQWAFLCTMCGIVVGRQYLVSYVIYIILICKHIKCWDCTVFNMFHPPPLSSAWCDHIALLQFG